MQPAGREAGTCAALSALQRAVLYVGMGLLVVTVAGTNPTSLPFGADQFDESDERHKGGLAHFYNWYYAISMAATFLALTVIVYVQVKVGWGLGFAIVDVFYGPTHNRARSRGARRDSLQRLLR